MPETKETLNQNTLLSASTQPPKGADAKATPGADGKKSTEPPKAADTKPAPAAGPQKPAETAKEPPKGMKITQIFADRLDKPDESWRLEFGPPKTPASERIIPLSETAVKVLCDVREQQKLNKVNAGEAYEEKYNLVFCTQLGRPLDPVNMRRTFYRICDKAGISDIHPHCLRHTFATRGVESGVDVRVMQSFLGHANFQETVDIYTHVSNELKRDEMQKLSSTMNY